MKIKVCGMRDEQNIKQLVTQINPDFIGLIFHPSSPRLVRSLSLECIEFIKNHQGQLKLKNQLIGVFTVQKYTEILSIADRFCLDILQLHDSEHHNAKLASQLKNKGYKIIKVFSLKNGDDFNHLTTKINQFVGISDYLLFDTQTKKYGGSGKKFDWNVLASHIPIDYFLSGGLSLKNISDCQQFFQDRQKKGSTLPFALDLNSQFEIEPALKDIVKIKTFIKQINLILSQCL